MPLSRVEIENVGIYSKTIVHVDHAITNYEEKSLDGPIQHGSDHAMDYLIVDRYDRMTPTHPTVIVSDSDTHSYMASFGSPLVKQSAIQNEMKSMLFVILLHCIC